MTSIRVADGDRVFSFDFDDLLKFHGTKSICGLTVSLKIMEAAWTTCWKHKPPARDEISVHSGFPGPGTRDGFEIVTRAISHGAYHILNDPPSGPLVAEAAKGAYFFRVSAAGASVELGLKPEVVPDDFVARRRLLQSGEASENDAKTFRQMQFEFSDHLRALKPFEAVNVLTVSGLDP